jgi:hypothetical protein
MRKTGSRQSRGWIRTRRARDHMQARAQVIQRAPRGSPQHLTLTRWPGGLLFHDLGSPSASEPTATAPSRDSRPKGPRAAPVLRFLLTQSEYSGVFRERQRRRSGAVESRTGNLVSTRIDTPCLHVHETYCALGRSGWAPIFARGPYSNQRAWLKAARNKKYTRECVLCVPGCLFRHASRCTVCASGSQQWQRSSAPQRRAAQRYVAVHSYPDVHRIVAAAVQPGPGSSGDIPISFFPR